MVDEDAPPDRRRVPMLCPVAALINHSCEPNCSYEGVFLPSKGVPATRVYAEEDIEEGEEISICYVIRNATGESRRAKLKAMYGFECVCPRCASGVEDTICFSDPAAGPIPSPCPTEGPLAALLARREAFLEANGGRPAVLLGLSDFGAPSPPLLAQGDQLLYSALYGLLGGLWSMDASNPSVRDIQCAVGTACVNNPVALSRAGRGRCFASDALVVTGHFFALAGRREEARGFYSRAAALLAALYGEGDFRVAFAAGLAESPPRSRLETERAEAEKLARTRNWAALYGVARETVERWVRGAPSRTKAGGPAGAASDANAMKHLLAASRAILSEGGLLARV